MIIINIHDHVKIAPLIMIAMMVKFFCIIVIAEYDCDDNDVKWIMTIITDANCDDGGKDDVYNTDT